MNRSSMPGRQSGVTLIELVTALVVALLVLILVSPDFTNIVRQIRISSATNELYNAITLTRTEALSSNSVVNLLALNNDWRNGWIILDAAKKQILVHAALQPDIKIEAKFSDGLQHIAYNGTGHSVANSSSATQYGHIKLSLGAHVRIIIVNFLGRTRICNPTQDKYCDAGASN